MNRYIRYIYVVCLFSSCAVNTVDIHSIEKDLNSLIGREAPIYTKQTRYWTEINMNETTKELEFNRPDGCAYAILIDNKTNIVKSWGFTSEGSLCEREIYTPSGV